MTTNIPNLKWSSYAFALLRASLTIFFSRICHVVAIVRVKATNMCIKCDTLL